MSRTFLLLFLVPLMASLAPLAAAEPFRPNLGPDLPRITVTCGEVTLLLRQKSQWTPGRIDFRGAPMTTENSAYGTVFSFPGVGFIGTQHLENEPEVLTSLRFSLDGKTIATPGESLRGDTFHFHRVSKIRDFSLECTWEVKDNRLYETTAFSTGKEIPLKLVYHFMHAWTPTVSAYLAGNDGEPIATPSKQLSNEEEKARGFHINKAVDWMAVYEPDSGQFAVSRLLESPGEAKPVSMLWNVPGTYRKYYLKNFDKDTVPAGFQGTWRMVTAFGSSAAEQWETAARKLAEDLRE
ncbi:MAG: hypothetical protein GXX91_16990 [Verrucomicrobiaceae bacterium]|nr:hypothetical protein [Verrucomicrobiaceae bacterium]